MPIFRDRPDPNYYANIVQYDDGSWAADPIPVDDTLIYPAQGGYAGTHPPSAPSNAPLGIKIPGVRTNLSRNIALNAAGLINMYAPPDIQRNFLYTLSTSTTGTAHDNAKAAMDWVAAVNTYRDQQITYVHTLNFNQLVAYHMPAGTPPWPVPPAFLPPVPPTKVGTAEHMLRFG